jgi:hypothetical protein
MTKLYSLLCSICLCSVATICICASGELKAEDPFQGGWAFELPDGGPAWLQILEDEGELSANLLWSVGSAKPCSEVKIQDGNLTLQRRIRWKPFGKSDESRSISEPMVGRIIDDELKVRVVQTNDATGDIETFLMSGVRIPPMPPQPDLDEVQFGEPIELFNGKDLTGWRLSNPEKENGWRVEDGVLTNSTPKTDFGAYGDYGNLRTDQEFEDFHLTIEYNVPSGGNSGIYLRGMYEAQVVDRDSRMQGIQGPGAIFGRIEPSENAGNPGGEWNRYEFTLVYRHITVVLNGRTVIDNQPLLGCTGGGMNSNDTLPGPIFLQGDHTSIQYRNMILRPVITGSSINR